MDHTPGSVVFDSCVARRAGPGGAQMLLFGGATSGGFFRGVPAVAVGMEEARGAAGVKRPFFTTHEELLEEYYDEQAPEKKRRLTSEQVRMLEQSFEEENKLEPERKTELARRLGMAPRQVAVWFQNRRARWKTKQLETDYDRLKAAYDALAADHHGLLSDNDRLRAQVVSLTDKLEGKETSTFETTTAVQEVDQPEEHTAGAGEEEAPTAQQMLKEDLLSRYTTNSAAVLDVADHSCESAYFAGEVYDCAGQYGSAPSSSSEDGGAASDEGCSFQLPDDEMFGPGIVHHGAAEEEAQLGSWTSWFWN